MGMPSNPKPARVLLTPGADFKQQAIPLTRQPQRTWFRVHRAGTPAVRFWELPHHRFSHPDGPFALLYVGASIQTCLWECFGDDVFQGQRAISAAKWAARCVSQIAVPELRVCAVNLERTRGAMGVEKASLMAADLSIPQAWGLAVQEHPAAFEAIKYSSRFLDQPCLVLFDRGGLPARLQVKPMGSLSDLDAAVDWLDERKAALV
ncbi:MAG: RES domain-containing protein [Verrucomicrobia bacterium]|nr:RES domain-containing protein [Verrucomicrobiota bacterium]